MAEGERREITFRLDILVEPDDEEYHAYCPALKGLHTCGATPEEALSNALDAAEGYLQSLIQHGDPIPLEVVGPVREGARGEPGTGQVTHHTQELSVGIV